MSTQNDVMEALVHAKQELQRAQKLTTADRKQVLQTTRAKLKEAQLKFQALRQQQQATTPALVPKSLPPISALQQLDRLVITNITGPDELVRYHTYQEHGNINDFDAIRRQASEMAAPAPSLPDNSDAQEKAKRLEYLKDKLSKLKFKQQQSQQSKKASVGVAPTNGEGDNDDDKDAVDSDAFLFDEEHENDDTTVPASTRAPAVVKQSKEHLMKRQEELQAQMDIAYWKKLVAKQKKLLEEQEHKAREIQVELQEV